MNPVARIWYSVPRFGRLLIILGISIALWEGAVDLFKIKPFLLPPPSSVLAAFIDNPAYFTTHTWVTLYETLLGFALAVVIGVVAAVAIVSSRFLEETLYVFLTILNGIPKVAIAPLFVVWMGTGIEPKVAIAAMVAVFVIVIDLVLGLKSVDPEMLDLAKSMKATTLQTLVRIRFPSALPNLFAGMKVGVTLALIGAVVGEFIASRRGLGNVILAAQGQFDMPTMFVGVVILTIMGTVLFFAVDVLERVALPWHASRRREAAQELAQAAQLAAAAARG
jgi:NitT/TauT family transport system permease protein